MWDSFLLKKNSGYILASFATEIAQKKTILQTWESAPFVESLQNLFLTTTF